jgi:hypothetical protein
VVSDQWSCGGDRQLCDTLDSSVLLLLLPLEIDMVILRLISPLVEFLLVVVVILCLISPLVEFLLVVVVILCLINPLLVLMVLVFEIRMLVVVGLRVVQHKTF